MPPSIVHTWTIFTTAGSPELFCFQLTGFFGAVGRDPVRSYREILTRMSIGLGDDALATARSLSTARRRAIRADKAEAASATV